MAEAKKETKIKKEITLNGVHAKLAAARVALQNSGIIKTGKNTYSHYDYFQLADFLPKTNEIFANVGLLSQYTLAPKVIASSKTTMSDGTIVETPVIKDMATLKIIDVENKDFLIYEMEVEKLERTKQQNGYQAAGGRSTYYKRYLFRDALEIEENDDTEAQQTDKNNFEVYTPTNNMMNVPTAQPMMAQPMPMTQPVIEAPMMQQPMMEAPMMQQPMMEAPMMPVQNMGTEVAINPVGEVVRPAGLNPDDILCDDARTYVMNLIDQKGGNAYQIINGYCESRGIASPDKLLNKDLDGLVGYINGN